MAKTRLGGSLHNQWTQTWGLKGAERRRSDMFEIKWMGHMVDLMQWHKLKLRQYLNYAWIKHTIFNKLFKVPNKWLIAFARVIYFKNAYLLLMITLRYQFQRLKLLNWYSGIPYACIETWFPYSCPSSCPCFQVLKFDTLHFSVPHTILGASRKRGKFRGKPAKTTILRKQFK